MIKEKLHNETAILKKVANGDERAFRLLFDHYRNGIFTFAFNLFGSEVMAEELVQETFVKVWLARRSLPEVNDFASWVFIFCRNSSYNILKRIARERRLALELRDKQEIGDLTHDTIIYNELRGLLQQAIDNLPPQQKRVYIMSRENGLKREEIASKLNLSPETVKAHLALAMRYIKAFLSRYDNTLLPLFFLLKIFF